MKKTLIIAEKPSLAKEIKEMLAKEFNVQWRSNSGYFESDEYILSWFFGHLLSAISPEEYDERNKEWKKENLPIMPFVMMYKYKPAKDGRSGTEQQGKMLAGFTSKCECIVNATDPDREGEGIFRLWYKYEKMTLPTKRLWAPSLAMKDLKKSWENMKLGEEYDNLADAQQMRAESDWLVGMNATRAYSIAGNKLLPIGRVKTATLAIVVNRDSEVENFKNSFFYNTVGNWNGLKVTYYDHDNNKDLTEESAKKILESVTGKEFSLSDFKKEIKKKNPPKTFSMPDLQKEANKRFSFSLDKTLSLTQTLYEKKLVSYPRTDSPYLPVSDLEKYQSIIGKLISTNQKDLLLDDIEKSASVKNTKSPHTAIIPTGVEPSGISSDETTIYNMIKDRFIYAFLKPYIYEQYSIEIKYNDFTFRNTTVRDIDLGFLNLKSSNTEEETENTEKVKEEISKDKYSNGVIENLKNDKKKRSKPKYYTPATLLTAMMTVGRTVESAESKEILRDVEGLGTAATRDKFPKELVRNGYLQEKGKNLISTPKGRNLIKWVKDDLKSPELTAQWESKLRKMEHGEYPKEKYKDELREFVQHIVKIDAGEAEIFREDLLREESANALKCPKCGKPLRKLKWGHSCNKECGFTVSSEILKKKLNDKVLKKLLETKATGIIKGFWSAKKEKKFDARLVLDSDFKVKLSFDNPSSESVGKCPKCGKALTSFIKGYKCPDSECGFIMWDTFAKKKIPLKNIKQLFEKGITDSIDGFVSQAGKKYSAKIKFDENHKPTFQFN